MAVTKTTWESDQTARPPGGWAWWIAGLTVVALSLTVLPLWLAAALVGGLFVIALTVIEPAFGLYAAILSVPVQELLALPAGLTVTQAVVVLAFGTWIIRVLAHPDQRLNLKYMMPWGIFLTIQLASIAFTPYSPIEGLLQWARWVAAFLAFVLTLGTIKRPWQVWGLVIALLLGPTIAALIGLVQFVVPTLAPESFLILGGRFARASATFGKPNPFAGYLNMGWPIALALAGYWVAGRSDQSTIQNRKSKILIALVFAGFTFMLLAGLFASYSRGGWIGAIFGVAAMAIVGGRRTATLAGVAVLIGLLVGLLGAFSILPPAFADRFTTITSNLRIFDAGEVSITDDNFAIVERMAHWQAGWRMFNEYPLLGVGTGNFNVAYPEFFVAPWAVSQGHAHNYYIHTLAETGIIGLCSYALLIGVFVREALRARLRLRGTVWGAAAVGVCGIIAAVAGHNIFENLHVLNLGIQLSGVWGLTIIAQRTDDTQV